MSTAGEYECKLLADLLPACQSLADFFARSSDPTATQARSGTKAFTYYVNLNHEFCRLHAGQYVLDDNTLTVANVGVMEVLGMLESRTPISGRGALWYRKSQFPRLERVRMKLVRQQAVKFDILRKLLRFDTDKQQNRDHILLCLSKCNPDTSTPLPLLGQTSPLSHGTKPASAIISAKSPIAILTRLATLCHQLLCENWACKCTPAGSHVAAKLLLTTRQSNKTSNRTRFELLFSTSDEQHPWKAAEIDVVSEVTSSEKDEVDALDSGGKKGTGRKVKFQAREVEIRSPSVGMKRLEVENICQHVRAAPGARSRLLVENNSMRKLSPARQKIRDLDNTVHIPLSSLIQNGYFLRHVSDHVSDTDRVLLIYIIASSIMSLYQGPWLDPQWTKSEICFLSPDGDLASLDLRKPLLCTKVIPVDVSESRDQPNNIHPEPRIAALGILMLEIALGINIESKRDDEPLNPNTDLLNADKLLEQMQNDRTSIPKLVSAIQTCLQPEDILDGDLSDQLKQESLHSQIVGPLEEIVTAFGFKIEDINPGLGGDPPRNLQERPVRPTLEPQTSSMQRRAGFGPAEHIENTGTFFSEPKKTSEIISAQKWFEDLENFVFPLIASPPQRRVKIAILDSGIDLPNAYKWAHENRKITYQSWVQGVGTDGTNGTDTHGHGTHAAGLLLRVGPNAEIYVAQITKDGSTFDPPRIAEAIEFATNRWQVDIITMSFGFQKMEPTIDKALSEAAGKKIIILAAASNSGNRQDIAWPARSHNVICIHSLNGDGDHSSYTPNSRPQDFAILGQAVSSCLPPHSDAGMDVLRSGTSCAAPIAAGVAANALEYAQQNLPKYAGGNSGADSYIMEQLLKSNSGMKALFKLMSVDRGGYKCIVPWKLLNHERKESTMCDTILEELRKI